MLARLGALARRLAGDLAALECREDVALVSCIGSGLEDNPELVVLACERLHTAEVAVRELPSDTHSLSFVVPGPQRTRAVQVLHEAFVARRSAST